MLLRLTAPLLFPLLSFGAQNPTLTTFETNLHAAYVTASAHVGVPAPKIPMGIQEVPLSVSYFETNGACNPSLSAGSAGACVYDNPTAPIAYFNALNRAGLSTVDINIVLSPLAASSQYTAYCAANPSTTNCFSASAAETKALANVDSTVSTIVAAGKSIAFAPTLDGPAALACGLTSSSTLAQIQACYLPLVVALAERYSMIRLTLVHEFTGVAALTFLQTLTPSQAATLITALGQAVFAVEPSIPLGVGFIGGENNYATAIGAVAATADLSFGGEDIYGGNCDVTQYPNVLNAYLTIKATLVAAGLYVGINESARPRWCAIGGSANEPNAYQGAGDILWSSSSTACPAIGTGPCTSEDDRWLLFFTNWAAQHGFLWLSVWDGQPMIWYTAYDSTGASDNLQAGPYMGNLMNNLSGNTETGTWHARLNVGWQAGFVGHAGATGHAGAQ